MSREIKVFKSKTGILMVRDVETGDTLPFSELVKAGHEEELILIPQETVPSITVNGTKLEVVEGYEYVTGRDVEHHLQEGETLYFTDLEGCMKLIYNNGIGRLYSNRNSPSLVESGYRMDEVTRKFWLIKSEQGQLTMTITKFEMYFHKETDEWIIKNSKTSEEDFLEIEFTGFISKQEEVVKETLEPKVEESKPFVKVTDYEAVQHLLAGDIMLGMNSDTYLNYHRNHPYPDGKLSWRDINGKDMTPEGEVLDLEFVRKNEWWMKECRK